VDCKSNTLSGLVKLTQRKNCGKYLKTKSFSELRPKLRILEKEKALAEMGNSGSLLTL
jgi:hypothetical protein